MCTVPDYASGVQREICTACPHLLIQDLDATAATQKQDGKAKKSGRWLDIESAAPNHRAQLVGINKKLDSLRKDAQNYLHTVISITLRYCRVIDCYNSIREQSLLHPNPYRAVRSTSALFARVKPDPATISAKIPQPPIPDASYFGGQHVAMHGSPRPLRNIPYRDSAPACGIVEAAQFWRLRAECRAGPTPFSTCGVYSMDISGTL